MEILLRREPDIILQASGGPSETFTFKTPMLKIQKRKTASDQIDVIIASI